MVQMLPKALPQEDRKPWWNQHLIHGSCFSGHVDVNEKAKILLPIT